LLVHKTNFKKNIYFQEELVPNVVTGKMQILLRQPTQSGSNFSSGFGYWKFSMNDQTGRMCVCLKKKKLSGGHFSGVYEYWILP
jgi:hypothetical protein